MIGFACGVAIHDLIELLGAGSVRGVRLRRLWLARGSTWSGATRRSLDEANKVAAAIAGMSLSAARMAKEAVDRSFETTLSEGLLYERRLFHSAFATDDQTEGMAAFTEKRAANFTHR